MVVGSSLSLVRNADRLAIVSHGHPRRSFFRTDRTRLVLVLDECDPFPSWHQPNLLETLEPAEDRGEALLVRVVWQIPEEQNLVRGKVFVWNNGTSSGIGRLETRASRSLGWTAGFGSGRTSRTLEFLLCFEGFLGLFAL